MGGALGVAVFGALLSKGLGRYIPEGLTAAGVEGGGGGRDLLGTPDANAALPGPVRDAVLGGFADSLSDTIAIPVAVLGFLGVLPLPELPLRTSVRNDEPVTDGERFGAALETSFVDDADVPDLTAGARAGDRPTPPAAAERPLGRRRAGPGRRAPTATRWRPPTATDRTVQEPRPGADDAAFVPFLLGPARHATSIVLRPASD